MVHWGTLDFQFAPMSLLQIDMPYIYLYSDGSLVVHWVHQCRFTGSPGAGSLVHWCTGSLVHLVHRCTGSLVHLVHWFTGSPVHRFTGSLVHWFTWFTGALVHLVHWCTGSLVSDGSVYPRLAHT